jgi:hypothetical protein
MYIFLVIISLLFPWGMDYVRPSSPLKETRRVEMILPKKEEQEIYGTKNYVVLKPQNKFPGKKPVVSKKRMRSMRAN